MSQTLLSLISETCTFAGERPALLDGEYTFSYRALLTQVGDIEARLRALGVARQDRLALVMPDGMLMAVMFLGAASAAAAAPLNPRYSQAEFAFYLGDLKPKAMLLPVGSTSSARAAAEELGIPVIEVRLVAGADGPRVVLPGDPICPAVEYSAAEPGDIALILHTSGTTSRPKMVPLTQGNLSASAASIADWLALSPQDRCLNVMPLFHIHGLVACLLASLRAGASVACTPGFSGPDFFPWLERFQPTWYSAVPTMHQTILSRAGEHAGLLEHIRLRFIRSSSAALPPAVMAALEKAFGAPVVEAYGMTEAAHQMASNPLPPAPRKPGTVGLAAGPQVAVLSPAGGDLLPLGSLGEIVIRGSNVMGGYLENPEANQSAFSSGWFRTGDQGFLDSDGYLTITGRLKELINRGGEKIAPREVDEALLAHPAVAQAVAFAMPDPQLGEEVAAAIVLRPSAQATPGELQRHVAARLASFKVPRRIVFLDEIPKGPTGKLQRIGLAERLGLLEAVSPAAPQPAARADPQLEALLSELWCEILRLPAVEVDIPFIELGGDSLQATRLVNRLCEILEIELSLVDFFDAATIAQQAWVVQQKLLEAPTPDAGGEGLQGAPEA